MKTGISSFIAAIAFLLLGTPIIEAQNVYFKKNGATVFQSAIAGIDSIVFRQTDTPALYAIDLRNETDIAANLCFVHEDGSYAVFYFNTDNQHYAIHIGASIETANLNDGYDIILDNNGYPQFLKSKDISIYFSNFSGNTFDAAIDYNGEVQYLWGCQSSIDFEKLLTTENQASFFRSIKAFNEKLNYIPIPQNWREFEIACSTVLRVVGVAVTAVALVAAGTEVIAGGSTIVIAIAAGTFVLNGLGIVGYLTDIGIIDSNFVSKITTVTGDVTFALNPNLEDFLFNINDYWYDSIMDDIDDDILKSMKDMDYRPYQIQLSQYSIDAGYNPLRVIIHVTSKTNWEIVNASTDWCVAARADDETIVVGIDSFFRSGSRQHTFTIQNHSNQNNIKPVYISVTQTGLIYSMIPNELDFEAEGGTKSFAIQINNPTITVDNIEQTDTKKWCDISWDQVPKICTAHVTAKPNDGAERSDNLFVTFKFGYEENQKLGEIIKVTQKSKEETDTTEESQLRTLLVKLYHDTDGDNWNRKDNWLSDRPIGEWYGVSYKNGDFDGDFVLHLSGNNLNGNVDFSGFTCSIAASFGANQLTSINVNGCTGLTSLGCEDNHLTSLNANKCTMLKSILCQNNQLTTLNVEGCTMLSFLYCQNNKLTSLDVNGLSNLGDVLCYNNSLTNLNVNGCSSLWRLWCNNNKILLEVPTWFSQLTDFLHDVRYYYYYDFPSNSVKYTDTGVGWWYPGEPEKGYHGW